MSDELTISLLLTCAAMTGIETVKARGWQRWTFATFCGVTLVAGLAWHLIKGIYPPFTDSIARLAGSPQTWFTLTVVALVWIATTARKKSPKEQSGNTNTVLESVPAAIFDASSLETRIEKIERKVIAADANFKQSQPDLEKLRHLDRTTFLLSTAIVQSGYKRELETALRNLPQAPDDLPIDTNEKLTRETNRIQTFLTRTGALLSGSHWGAGFMHIIRTAEIEAETDLLSRNETPSNLNAQRYRLFHIAAMSRDRVADFLERSISEAANYETDTLTALREELSIRNRSR